MQHIYSCIDFRRSYIAASKSVISPSKFSLRRVNALRTFSIITTLALFQIGMVHSQITSPPDPCDDGTQATCQCDTAPILCTIDDLDGFTYSMSDFQHPQNGPSPLCNGQGVPNNPTWFAFIAWCEDLTLNAELTNCEPGCTGFFCSGPPSCQGACNEVDGIQIVVYEDCVNFNSVACNVTDCGNEDDKTLSMSGLVLGEVYYILVDGCAGSFCDVTINVVGTCGSAEIEDWTNPIDGPDTVCVGTSEIFTVDDLEAATQYHWYINGNEIDLTSEPSNELFWDVEGSFELCVDASNPPCIEVSADPEPICMTVEVVFPQEFLGEFNICAADLPFEVDGFTFFDPGPQSYIVTSPEGCDTLKTLELNVIENAPEPRDTFVCIDDFPFFYPPLGETIFSPGEYLIQAEDQFGCDSTYWIIFREMVFIQLIQASEDTLRCPEEQITLSSFEDVFMNDDFSTPVDIIGYEWLLDGDPLPGGMGPNVIVDQEGTYTLVLTGTIGDLVCTDTATFTLPAKFESPPDPIPTISDEICINTVQEATVLNASPDYSVNWSIEGAASIISTSDNSAMIEFEEAGEVTICAEFEEIDCPELTSDSCITVIVTEGTGIDVSGNDYICEGGTTTLQVESPFSEIFWNGESGGAEFEIDEAGPVEISLVDSIGCVSDTIINISEEFLPIPEIMGSRVFCEDGFTELSVSQDFVEVNWSTGENTFSIEVNTEGVVEVEVTDELGCTGTNSVEISLADDLDVSIIGPGEICEGQTANLSLSDAFAEVEWSTGSEEDSILVDQQDEYSVLVGDGRGCFGTDTFLVTVNPLPTGEFEVAKEGLCPGESIEILFETNDNITQYIWPDSSDQNNWTAEETGLVQLTIVDENGCIDSFSLELEAFENPEPLIEGPEEFCTGESIELSVNETFESYAWSNGEETQTIEVTEGGNYSVEVTDQNECTATAEFEVTENPLPDPDIAGDLEVCEGETSLLSTENDYESYNWSTGESGPEITVSETQLVSVEVEDINGCTNSTEVQFTVNSLPEIEISGSTTFCTGFSTTLQIDDFPEIEWSTGETTPAITISEEGEYSVTVTDANGCENETSVFITEDEELQPNIGGEPGFCPGESTVLNVGDGFVDYEWSTGETSTSITVTAAGTYSVTVTDTDGCTGSASVAVQQYDPPEPEITGTAFICFEETGLIEVADIYEAYQWSTGSTMSNSEVEGGGIYSVTVTDQNGCTGTAEFEVTENPEIIPSIEGPEEICRGEFASIQAEQGFTSYSWSSGQGQAGIGVGETGIYTVTVTDDNGCTGENSFELTVNELPPISAGQDMELNCITEEVTLGDPDFDPEQDLTFEWLNEDLTSVLAEGTLFVTDEEGVYIFRVTDNTTGCVSTESAQVTRDPNDITGFEIEASGPLCFGDENGFIEVLEVQGGSPPINYQLNEIQSPDGFFGQLGPGEYELVITDEIGCEVDTLISFDEPPQVIVSLGGNIEIQVGSTTTLEGEVSIGPDRIDLIRWLINQSPFCDPCDELEIQFEEPSTATVTLIVTDINGCSASDQITVSVIFNRNVYIPNAFSPNDDGVNDAFIVYGEQDLFEVEKLRVFDRWGNKVFERENIQPNDPEAGWDGTFRGEKMNPGIYVYHLRVRYIDGEVRDFSGDVMLID
ncbi:MAG: gliding motility-associated C-terminal domain-containing protein [Saprospirales bacterium]|nr:MAG: gliding motility-associated C-terminal domain-containing protein [Saprospirales bacterium]